jgi:hypothetical protein
MYSYKIIIGIIWSIPQGDTVQDLDPEPNTVLDPEHSYGGKPSTSKAVSKPGEVVPFPDTHEKCFFKQFAENNMNPIVDLIGIPRKICLACKYPTKEDISSKKINTCYTPSSFPDGFSYKLSDKPVPDEELFPPEFFDGLPPKKSI